MLEKEEIKGERMEGLRRTEGLNHSRKHQKLVSSRDAVVDEWMESGRVAP